MTSNEIVEPDVQVMINLGALLNRAVAPVTETAKLMAYGLTIADQADVTDVQIPGALVQLWGPEPFGDPQAARTSFSSWLASAALRRYIEVYSAFLEELGFILSLVRRSKATGEGFDERVVRKRLNKLPFPLKLSLGADLGAEPVPADQERLVSINDARNCYEHRQGVVQRADTNDGDQLTVKWTRFAIEIRAVDGSTRPVDSLPAIAGPGESVAVRTEPASKSFALGSRVNFSPVEIGEIGLTLNLTALSIVKRMEYGRRYGLVPSSGSPPGCAGNWPCWHIRVAASRHGVGAPH